MMTKAGMQLVAAKSTWLLLAACVYSYAMRQPIDHFWALAVLIPFYIKIFYTVDLDASQRGALDAAKQRLVQTNNVVLIVTTVVLAALADQPGAVPFIVTALLVVDVASYLSPRIARPIAALGSRIPAFLRA